LVSRMKSQKRNNLQEKTVIALMIWVNYLLKTK
jgi:hypothetical protein